MAVPLTARAPVEFTPPSAPEKLRAIDPSTELPKFAVSVRVPTPYERDGYNAALVRGGVTSYTKTQIRQIGLAGIQELFPKEEHDDLVALLRENWAAEEAHAEMEKEQRAKLLELLDEARAKGGADAMPKNEDVKKALEEIRPSVVMDQQRQIRAVSIAQEIGNRYPPMREALAALVEQDAKRAWLNAEVYVTGWRGLEHEPDGNGRGGITRHEADYLRTQIGESAFHELSDFITSMHGLDEDEEKNLASLLESMSVQIGSTQSTSKASSEDGNSTDESSTATQESTGSRTTTAKSSGSGPTAKTTKKAASGNGRTARRSSTSR